MGEVLRYSKFLETYKTRSYRLNHLEDYKRFFPVMSSPLLAGVVADLICDGHLQGSPIWRMDFTSRSVSELDNFNERIKRLFNISGKIRKCTSNKFGESFNLGINCSPIARILFLCGVPAGQKVLTKFSLPRWIKEDKECFRAFCQRMFTCEGSIMHEKKRRMPQIRLEMWKSEELLKDGVFFMEEVCSGLKKYFDISTTITLPKSKCVRKDEIVTTKIKIYILGESVIKFYNKIGFCNDKQQSLKALLTSNFRGSLEPELHGDLVSIK